MWTKVIIKLRNLILWVIPFQFSPLRYYSIFNFPQLETPSHPVSDGTQTIFEISLKQFLINNFAKSIKNKVFNLWSQTRLQRYIVEVNIWYLCYSVMLYLENIIESLRHRNKNIKEIKWQFMSLLYLYEYMSSIYNQTKALFNFRKAWY